jgi:hypothetical protein
MTLGTSRPHARVSPALCERSRLGQKRPCGTRLVREVPGFVHNRRRLNEELIRPVLEALPRPGHVDDGIDHEIGDVDALRPHLARDRFRKDTSRGLGRREASEIRLVAQRPSSPRDEAEMRAAERRYSALCGAAKRPAESSRKRLASATRRHLTQMTPRLLSRASQPQGNAAAAAAPSRH